MTKPNYQEIVKARDQCAQIVARYGVRYLPIFKRLDKEAEKLTEERKILDKAILLSRKIDTQNDIQIDTQFIDLKYQLMKIFNKNS